MPCHRMTMHKTREILRLKYDCGLSNREIGQSCRISPSSVSDTLRRARQAGLSWPLADECTDEVLEAQLYCGRGNRSALVEPDYAEIHRELRNKGVTLELLWQEYKSAHPDDGYQYSRYCQLYREWKKGLDVVMRQTYRGGEKLFVDYAGLKAEITNPETGEITTHAVFVATLGASNFTYAEAQESEDSRSWIGGHIRAFEYFGGSCEVTVPDNLKVGVTKPNFYDPDINRSYQELAEHYGTVILPARVRKPRDKSKVENAVLQVERWVMAPLRNQRFFSLKEYNRAFQARLSALNDRPFSKLSGTRRTLFQEIDQPVLRPLPKKRFEIADWKPNVGVNIDHHIEYDKHYYSVPYRFVGKRIDIRATLTTIECFHKRTRIASHLRSFAKGRYSTDETHRPKSHQKSQWSPSRLIRWAETIGTQTARLVSDVLQSRPHPEQGYRACLGILRLGKRYGDNRLEAACHRANVTRAVSYRSVVSILKHGLDTQPLPPKPQKSAAVCHKHIRGANYYQTNKGEQPTCSTNKPSTNSIK